MKAKEKEKKPPVPLDKRLIVILLVIFVQILGASMVVPILPLYATKEFGMSYAAVTLLNASFFGAQFLAGPFIGRASDKYGRVPVLIISQIGTVFSYILLGVAGSVSMLFFARILDGITGGNIIVARAYVVDITPKEQRTQALGYIFVAFGAGFIIGPAVGGILAKFFGYHLPYFFAAFAAFIVVCLTYLVLDETLPAEQRAQVRQSRESDMSVRSVITNLPLVSILLITFGSQFAFSMLQATFSLYGESVIFVDTPDVVELGVGLLLASIGIGQVFTQLYLVKRLVDRFGDSRLIVIGTAVRSLAMFAVVIFVHPLIAVIPLVLFAMGAGLQMPALQSLATDTVSDDQRGGVMGLYQSSLSLSIIFGGAIAGSLFAIQPVVPYLIGGVIFALMALPAWFLVRWTEKHRHDDEQTDDPIPGVKPMPVGD